ncbi:hypothetical protein SAMN03159496_04040 [Rhizobium sp. NFR07]|uniref:hypothetical protein n=1 Tax=Rhizobium sp. NFR07 TaxID=1566262 RepID=UPI0008E8EB7D|nr:hypothetical protein [Rhizobium sp. NFR07]SFB46820.1 hypothetical protein SAMN03159496_04040 [Rhizobium sp. NFR07]
MVEDRRAQESIEGGSGKDRAGKPAAKTPAGGPHAKEHLTDHDKTPGTGSLPANGSKDTDAGPE